MIDELRSIVGPSHVLTDPAVTESYAVDWTGRFRGTTPAVVRPGSTEEVAAVVRACARHGVAARPAGRQHRAGRRRRPAGGRGRAVAAPARRLDAASVDAVAGQVTAGAGATIARVQAAAREAGWDYGVDWAARDTATVGGLDRHQRRRRPRAALRRHPRPGAGRRGGARRRLGRLAPRRPA